MTPDEMAALHARCFTTPRPWTAAEIEDLLGSAFVLSNSKGFVLGRVIADEAELLTIAVDPNAWRQGIGRELVAGFLKSSSEQGAKTAFLEVAADNQPAIALYESMGFAQVGERKRYYRRPDGQTLDAKVLRFNLGG